VVPQGRKKSKAQVGLRITNDKGEYTEGGGGGEKELKLGVGVGELISTKKEEEKKKSRY